MALRQQFSLIHSEFNQFLFAPVGQEENGADLTVLSALTRLDIDPWAEAARLSELPREAAARALAAAIAMLPAGDWKETNSTAIAARLVACLPRRGAPAPRTTRNGGGGSEKKISRTMILLVCVALAAAAVLALLHVRNDRLAESVPSAVSSTLR